MFGILAKRKYATVTGLYFAINENFAMQLHGMTGKVIKKIGVDRTLVELPIGKMNLPNRVLAIN